MPCCEEWGIAATLVALGMDTVGAGEGLTMVQRSHLITRLLVAQETIEEGEGSDALVHLPRQCLRMLHLASPQASAPRASSLAGVALLVLLPWKARSRAPRTGVPWDGTVSWTRLDKLPRSACMLFLSFLLSPRVHASSWF
jgi:hypothetical protein